MRTHRLLVSAILAGGAACTAERPAPPESMSDEEQQQFFLGAIRDSGFICAEVMSLQRIEANGSAWRISCVDLTAYLATVEADGSVTVSPAPYVETPASGRPGAPPVPLDRPIN